MAGDGALRRIGVEREVSRRLKLADRGAMPAGDKTIAALKHEPLVEGAVVRYGVSQSSLCPLFQARRQLLQNMRHLREKLLRI